MNSNDRLFPDERVNGSNPPRGLQTSIFDRPSDWDREIKRTGASEWRVCSVNQNYVISPRYSSRHVLWPPVNNIYMLPEWMKVELYKLQMNCRTVFNMRVQQKAISGVDSTVCSVSPSSVFIWVIVLFMYVAIKKTFYSNKTFQTKIQISNNFSVLQFQSARIQCGPSLFGRSGFEADLFILSWSPNTCEWSLRYVLLSWSVIYFLMSHRCLSCVCLCSSGAGITRMEALWFAWPWSVIRNIRGSLNRSMTSSNIKKLPEGVLLTLT